MADEYLIGGDLLGRMRSTIRRVEGITDGHGPTRLTPRLETISHGAASKTFRIGTFSGSWNKSEPKEVTFVNVQSTPNTATAINLFATLTNTQGSSRYCAVAREGTAWYLIAAEC
jgi:hypothetical protein